MSAPSTPPRRPAKRAPGLPAFSPAQGQTTSAGPSSPLAGPSQAQSQAIKHHDPAIERALQLSTFESNYSIEDFIGTLSEKVVAESKSNPGPFDSKPFLETFSPALDSLLSLRSQVAERTKKMETEVRRAEREYGRRLRELDGGFEAIGSSFSSLESKITDVGRTAVRIGEQLESLHQTRSTAQSTSLILSYYLSLVHQTSTTPDPNNPSASSTPLEALFSTRTSRDGRARLAVILRRLMSVAKDVADNAATAVLEAEAASAKETSEGGDGGDKGISAGGAKAINKRRTEKEKAERVRDEVERYCEKFEKEVLKLFDRSYRKGDPRMMATLQDFNGGASCVQIYVNQHDFFISKDRVLEDAERTAGEGGEDSSSDILTIRWKSIGDPDAPAPTSEPGMAALLKEIRVTVSQESQIVKAVFPDPGAVLQVFLQRVFAQVVQQHLESLMSRAAAISTLAVLRILNLTHSLCASLVHDLKEYDMVFSNEAGSSSLRGGMSGTGPLSVLLDHAMEEMFVPWLEGSRYLESENKNLVELYAGLLSRFTRYHETVLKAKPNSLLDKVVSQLSTSSTAATSSSTAQSAAAAISKYANMLTSAGGGNRAASSSSPTVASKPNPFTNPQLALDGTRSGAMTPVGGRSGLGRSDTIKGEAVNKGLEDKIWPADGALSMEVAQRMLKWHAEAVGRVVELSPASEVGKNAFALSKTLAEAIGRSLIETVLDSSLAKLENLDSKIEPDLSSLTVFKPADLICHLWQRYTSTAILPLAGTNAPLRREMGTSNSHNTVRMEGKINAVIQKALDIILNWLAAQLTKQKKNDYKPKNDDLSFARNNTEPCELCCEFLETVRDVARESLSGKNAEVVLTEVGVAFHSQLLDHYKRFPVNPTGGLMLTKDLASYQEIIATFAIPALNDRFDMLRQLGNSFIVQPNVLKSYMTESHLGRIDARLLRPYLAQRSDYSSFAKSLQLDDGVVDDPHSGSTTATMTTGNNTGSLSTSNSSSTLAGPASGLGHRSKMSAGSRLSVMTGVAGAGMGKLKEMLKEFEAPLISEETESVNRKARESIGVPGTTVSKPPAPMPRYVPMYYGM